MRLKSISLIYLRKSRRLLLIGFLILISVGIQNWGVLAETQPAPYFILPRVNGQVLRSSQLKGKVVLMVFFQTWCPDCQRISPQLETLYKKYKTQDFIILGISHDPQKEKHLKPYIKKHGLSFPILLGDHSIAVNYLKVSSQKPRFSIPYLILIDRNGNIVGRFIEGQQKETQDIKLLEKRITPLLELSVSLH